MNNCFTSQPSYQGKWKLQNFTIGLPRMKALQQQIHCQEAALCPDPVGQAVRVKIGRVCALLEEITIFCPDDQ